MHPTPSSTKPLIFQYFHHSIPQPRYIFAAIVDGITQPDVAPFAFTKIPNGSFNIKLVPKPFFRFVTFCIFPKVETNEPNTQMSASATQTAGKATAAACDVRRAEEHVTRKTTHTSTRTLLHTLPCSHRSDASAWGARVVNDFQIWREHHHCLRGNNASVSINAAGSSSSDSHTNRSCDAAATTSRWQYSALVNPSADRQACK